MLSNNLEEDKTYSNFFPHFYEVSENAPSEFPTHIEKEFEQVQKSMDSASKDYEIMMKIHQELTENFQKLVQKKG